MVDTSNSLIMKPFLLASTLFTILFCTNIKKSNAQPEQLIDALNLVFELPEVHKGFAIGEPVFDEKCENNVLIFWPYNEQVKNDTVIFKSVRKPVNIGNCVFLIDKNTAFFHDPVAMVFIDSFKENKNQYFLNFSLRWFDKTTTIHYQAKFEKSEKLELLKCFRITQTYRYVKRKVKKSKKRLYPL